MKNIIFSGKSKEKFSCGEEGIFLLHLMIQLPLLAILLGTLLFLSRNFFVVTNQYYAMRETHYTSVEALERYRFALLFTPESEIKNSGCALKTYPAYKISRDTYFDYTVSPYGYTYSGKKPYYVNYKRDNQYIVDQMNFSKPLRKINWQFHAAAPQFVEIKGTLYNNEDAAPGTNFLNYRCGVYLRGKLRYEQ